MISVHDRRDPSGGLRDVIEQLSQRISLVAWRAGAAAILTGRPQSSPENNLDPSPRLDRDLAECRLVAVGDRETMCAQQNRRVSTKPLALCVGTFIHTLLLVVVVVLIRVIHGRSPLRE
jgi:hypothetical protein